MDGMTGHNLPPSDENAFLSELAARHGALLARGTELLEAGERTPLTIEDAETAGKAADFIKQLTAHERAADRARTDEKAPYLQRGKWVDAFFKITAVAGIADIKTTMNQRLTAYQRKVAEEERRRRQEEERRQREEAERARRDAEARAAAAQTEEDLEAAVQAEADADEAQAQAERAERATEAGAADLSRQHSASGTVASLRTSWKCTEWRRRDLDLNALREHFADADIEKAIRGFIRAGGRNLSGAQIEEESVSRVA